MIFLNFDEYFLKVLTRILARKNQLSVVEKNGLKNHIDYLRFLWRFNVDFLNQVHECKYPNIKHGNFCVRIKFIWINKYPFSIQKVRAKRAHAYFSACPSKNVARSNSFHERTVQCRSPFHLTIYSGFRRSRVSSSGVIIKKIESKNRDLVRLFIFRIWFYNSTFCCPPFSLECSIRCLWINFNRFCIVRLWLKTSFCFPSWYITIHGNFSIWNFLLSK